MTLATRVTDRAEAFVAERRGHAGAIGRELAELLMDPDAFATALADGFEELADPEYRDAQPTMAPGIGPVYGVRLPLQSAVMSGFRRATRPGASPAVLLFLADRLLREPELEMRLFSFALLDRIVPNDPERAWQLLRRAAREANEWITVDSLARPIARGILLEPYRWAELEQLVYSPRRWERRLVGSTIATIPHVDRHEGRTPAVVRNGLDLVGNLIGDADPDVQKALSWALRTLAQLDLDTVTTFCEGEAEEAERTRDGNRAWVLRDTLPKLKPDDAERIRRSLAGIRRTASAGSTSRAAVIAARFGDLPLGRTNAEPPLT